MGEKRKTLNARVGKTARLAGFCFFLIKESIFYKGKAVMLPRSYVKPRLMLHAPTCYAIKENMFMDPRVSLSSKPSDRPADPVAVRDAGEWLQEAASRPSSSPRDRRSKEREA